jgi:hypothetical protein
LGFREAAGVEVDLLRASLIIIKPNFDAKSLENLVVVTGALVIDAVEVSALLTVFLGIIAQDVVLHLIEFFLERCYS